MPENLLPLAAARKIVRRMDDNLLLRNFNKMPALWTRSLLAGELFADLKGRHAAGTNNSNRHLALHS